ncbi:MAG: 3-hydroxyacyl-ACP dehydratase [Chlorobi bacterium]|nr:3-hydroxyacyl-ACP dehydratase [Chlorobiota bacterium]
MLIENFYKTLDSSRSERGYVFNIKLKPGHEVYKGHFPDQPVVPGVIQLQIIKELLEGQKQLSLFMDSIVQVKYLRPILPDEDTLLKLEVGIKTQTPENIKSRIVISSGEIIFTKAIINFSIEQLTVR